MVLTVVHMQQITPAAASGPATAGTLPVKPSSLDRI